jgi:hypothetical protein
MAHRDLRLLAIEERLPGRTEVVVPGSGERFQRRSGERFLSSMEVWKMLCSCLLPYRFVMSAMCYDSRM